MKKKAAWLLLIAAAALLVLISATAFFINLYRDAIALGVAAHQTWGMTWIS